VTTPLDRIAMPTWRAAFRVRVLGDRETRCGVRLRRRDAAQAALKKAFKMLLRTQFETEFPRCQRDLVDVPALQRSNVLAISAGAVVSMTVDMVIRSSVGGVTVWDFDDVGVANLARSSYRFADVGRSKAKALAEHCRGINPLARVTAIHGDLRKAPDAMIASVAARHDVVLVAPDDFALHRRINRILIGLIPAVYTYVTNRGNTAEIVWTMPGQPGCIECLLNAEERAAAGVAVDFQALGVDVFRLALEAASVILGILLRGHQGGDLFEDMVDSSNRVILLFSRKAGALADMLPREVVSGSSAIDIRQRRRPCPVCERK